MAAISIHSISLAFNPAYPFMPMGFLLREGQHGPTEVFQRCIPTEGYEISLLSQCIEVPFFKSMKHDLFTEVVN